MISTSRIREQEVLHLKLSAEPVTDRAGRLFSKLKASSIFSEEEKENISLSETLLQETPQEALVLVLARAIEPAIERLADDALELLDWEEELMGLLQEALAPEISAESYLARFKEVEARLARGIKRIRERAVKELQQVYQKAAEVDGKIQEGRQASRSAFISIQEARLKSMDATTENVLRLSARVQDSIERVRGVAAKGADLKSNEKASQAVFQQGESLLGGRIDV